MDIPVKKLQARFYQTPSGPKPVREWLIDLMPEDRRIIGYDMQTAEFGWLIGMPLCRSLGDGLWEVRSHLSGGGIARIIFCMIEGDMVLLNSFIKKTQKTPPQEIELARKRRQEIVR